MKRKDQYSFDDIISKLKELAGLNTYEARAYISLLKLGLAKPLDVAKEANIPHQRIYDVLKSLLKKGLILEQGNKYVAQDPKEAFKALSFKTILNAKERSKRLEELGIELRSFINKEETEGLKIVYGLRESIAEASSVVENCNEKPIFMTYKAAERFLDFQGIFSVLIERLPKGTLIFVPKEVHTKKEVLEDIERVGVRIVESKFSFLDLMVACNTVIMGLPYGNDDVVSIVVKNKRFSNAIKKRLLDIHELEKGDLDS